MKALIVDDERHVREAIRLLADWEALGITELFEADNGLAAAELMERVRPEILITDMRMPVQDGVKLLEHAQRTHPQTQKIVVSGHTDFELVRSTMKYGGRDYLLKPVDPVQLAEALAKAVKSWHEADAERRINQKRSMEINQLKPVYWDKVMSGLIADPPEVPAALDERLADEFGPGVTGECRVALVSLDSAAETITRRFQDNRDLLFFSLTNICNEFLRRGNRGIACRHWNSDREALVIAWARTEELPGLMREINDGIERTLGSRLDVGIGGAAAFPAGAAESFKGARRALLGRNMKEKNQWIHTGEELPCAPGELRLAEHEESFRLALLSGSREELAKAVNGWIAAVDALPCVTLEQVERWRAEWRLLLRRLGRDRDSGGRTEDADPEEAARPIPLDADGRLSLAEWSRELTESLTQLLFERERGQREKGSMREIARYLEENYSRELSLQEIAEHFHLSREYISRRFKQEFGENLSDCLGRIRIGKAKLLLQNPHLRIAQIAEMVGYPDEKYFSKVFKKLAGKTPGEYRRSDLGGHP
ncbi:response regulator transcription factor [Gorillibacterium sp. sgz500922]|uniref:response regulator transcription factor n=1 Tax=Gorillibacterium sp. sgz500922 TaxID=3446694 RepID=UPI003F66B14C